MLAAVASLGAHAETAPAPIVIKFSHVVADDTPKGQAAEHFKASAEKLTKGRVRIEVYSNSSLFKGKDELEALQDGKVQMLAPSLATFGPIGVKEFEAFDLPYMFANRDALYRVTEGPIGKSMLAKLEPKGIIGLAYWDNGFKIMSSNKPLHAPADYSGQKMRIQASKVLDAQFRALGANPQEIGFAETYGALKNGVVDGTENSPSNMYTQKMNDVQKHLTITNHGYVGYAVVVNKKFWDGLPADIRASLLTALNEATAYEKIISQLDNDRSMDAIRKTGKTTIYTPTAAEDAAFHKALAPVQQQMEARIGKDLIGAIAKVAK
jgi:C4-dicarboxylate-binding protein DctP